MNNNINERLRLHHLNNITLSHLFIKEQQGLLKFSKIDDETKKRYLLWKKEYLKLLDEYNPSLIEDIYTVKLSR